MFELDRQRQLVLLRRDNVEHLVMIGGPPNDIVIEAGIARPPARQAAQPEAEAAPGAMRRPAAPLPEADPASVAPAVAAAAIGAAATAAAAPDRKVEPQFDAPASAPAPSEPVPPLRGSEAPLPVLRAESPVPKADPAPPELDDKQIAAAFEAELARVEAHAGPAAKADHRTHRESGAGQAVEGRTERDDARPAGGDEALRARREAVRSSSSDPCSGRGGSRAWGAGACEARRIG